MHLEIEYIYKQKVENNIPVSNFCISQRDNRSKYTGNILMIYKKVFSFDNIQTKYIIVSLLKKNKTWYLRKADRQQEKNKLFLKPEFQNGIRV